MTMLKWLCILAMYSSAGGPKVLEYGAFATEAECIEIGDRFVTRNQTYFANPSNRYAVEGEIWAVYECVDMQAQMGGRP